MKKNTKNVYQNIVSKQLKTEELLSDKDKEQKAQHSN